MIFARKICKIPEFYTIFSRKMRKFYVIIAREILFPTFRGVRALLPPVSYAYGYSVKFNTIGLVIYFSQWKKPVAGNNLTRYYVTWW